jgi:hypothetical protein
VKALQKALASLASIGGQPSKMNKRQGSSSKKMSQFIQKDLSLMDNTIQFNNQQQQQSQSLISSPQWGNSFKNYQEFLEPSTS